MIASKIVPLFLAGVFLIAYGFLVSSQDGSKNLPHQTLPAKRSQKVLSSTPTLPLKKEESIFVVTKVIDGDTIEIEEGLRVRYIGINTPETVDPRRPVQCFGKESSEKNKELVAGKIVRLEKDISEKDTYGRLLRYVFVDDASSGSEIFVNDYLVRKGYASATSYPPDVQYQEQFREAEKEAREKNLGLWEQCL